MTTVVIHPVGDDSDSPAWDAYITGIAPIRVTSMSQVNDAIRAAGITVTDLHAVTACITGPDCPYLATSSTLTAMPDAFIMHHSCDDHAPDPAGLPGPSHAITPAARPVHHSHRAGLPDVYRKGSATELGHLIRTLETAKVPPEVFAQPQCRRCRRLLHPVAGMTLEWHDTASSPCSRRPRHDPADCEVVQLLTRYYTEMLSPDGERAPAAPVAV